jgi:FkbM family methyltransferase
MADSQVMDDSINVSVYNKNNSLYKGELNFVIEEVDEIIKDKFNVNNDYKFNSKKFKKINFILDGFEKITSLRILHKKNYHNYLNSYLSLPERKICARTYIDFLQNQEEYYKVYKYLSDKDSKHVFLNVIKLRLSSLFLGRVVFNLFNFGVGLSDFKRLVNKYQYKNIISLKKGEVIIDAGAYVGKDSKIFAWINGFKNVVYALEPQEKPFMVLLNNVKKHNYDELIIPLKLGVWSSNTKKRLKGKGSSASVICTPNYGKDHCQEIDCIAIDDYFKDLKIGFIKMDVEGAELEALKGSKNIISNLKPKLAISVYHKARDLIDIPLFLKSIRPDYKLYIHQIHPGLKETILFAV